MILSEDQVRYVKDHILLLLESVLVYGHLSYKDTRMLTEILPVSHYKTSNEDDPVMLADYVIALLKHDSELSSSKEMCTKQLLEFLQEETEPFVNRLFTFLIDNNIAKVDLDKGGSPIHNKMLTANVIYHSKSTEKASHIDGADLQKPAHQTSKVYQHDEPSDEEDEDRNFKHTRRLQKGQDASSRVSSNEVKKMNDESDDDKDPHPATKIAKHSKSSSVSYSSSLPEEARDNKSALNDANCPNITTQPYSNTKSNNQTPYYQNQGIHSRRRISRGVKPPYCAKPDKRHKKMCPSYENCGYCLLGDSCPNSHDENCIVIDDIPSQQILQFFGARNFQTPYGLNRHQGRAIPNNVEYVEKLDVQNNRDKNDILRPPITSYTDNEMGVDALQQRGSSHKPSLTHKDNFEVSSRNDTSVNLKPQQENSFELQDNGNVPKSQNQGEGTLKSQNEIKHQHGGKNLLFISNIPREFFSIETINQYFKRFGTVINVTLKPNSKALVQFSNPQEAYAAHYCPDPVFNNRFVRVDFAKHEHGLRPSHYKPYSMPGSYNNTAGGGRNMVSYVNFQATPTLSLTQNVGTSSYSQKEQVAAVKQQPDQTPHQQPQVDDKKKTELTLTAGKIVEIWRDLIQKYIHEQSLILSKLKSGTVSEKEKEILLEQFARLSNLTKALIKDNASTRVKATIVPKQNSQSGGGADVSNLNAIKDSRQSVESEIKKLKAQIGDTSSEVGSNDFKKGNKDYARYFAGNQSASELSPPAKQGNNQKSWGVLLKIESKRPLPSELIKTEFLKFGPVVHLSATNNGLSHIIKFQNVSDARSAADLPFINVNSRKEEISITLINDEHAEISQPEYTDDGSIDYDIENYAAEVE